MQRPTEIQLPNRSLESPAETAQLQEPVYGLCSRELPPGLVQAMQQRLSRSQDWERIGNLRNLD